MCKNFHYVVILFEIIKRENIFELKSNKSESNNNNNIVNHALQSMFLSFILSNFSFQNPTYQFLINKSFFNLYLT